LRRHLNPPRRNHHRQPLHQRANHLERQAAGADDDGCPQFNHRHALGTQALPHLVPAAQVRRQIRIVLAQAAEIDDPPHARGGGGSGIIIRRNSILFFKIARRPHRMDEVVRGVDSLHGPGQRCRIEHIAGHDFDARRRARR
jgi:hypothetical protein